MYLLFLAPKIKYILNIDEYGITQGHRTFKGFIDSERLLKRNQNFQMINGNKISNILPLSWKKKFRTTIVIPNKTKYCNGMQREKKFVIHAKIELTRLKHLKQI